MVIYGIGNTDANLSTHDKQFPLVVKKTALRDVQNENRAPKSVGNSPLSKIGVQNMNSIKASGAKRPSSSEGLMNPPVPCHESSNSAASNSLLSNIEGQDMNSIKVSGAKRPSSSEGLKNPPVPRHESSTSGAPNSHLVYVRRKSEAEIGKLGHPEETAQPKLPLIKEPTVSSFPALAPLPVAPPINSSGKPSLPLPLGQSNARSAPTEFSYHPVGSTVPSSNPKAEKNMHWEERYRKLQMLLKKLDESDQEEYFQMLRSVSSVELSRHAIELEKRSIQLSLEEAKEVQRVAILNVLGKSLKNFKAPSTHQSQSEK